MGKINWIVNLVCKIKSNIPSLGKKLFYNIKELIYFQLLSLVTIEIFIVKGKKYYSIIITTRRKKPINKNKKNN